MVYNTAIADRLAVQGLLGNSIAQITVVAALSIVPVFFLVRSGSWKRCPKGFQVLILVAMPFYIAVIIGEYLRTPVRYGFAEMWSALGALVGSKPYLAAMWWISLASLPLAVVTIVIGVRRRRVDGPPRAADSEDDGSEY